MNPRPNAPVDRPSSSDATKPVEISPARRLYWSIRRELWENRSIYLAPLAVAALFLVGFFIRLSRLPERMRSASALGPVEQQAAFEQPYVLVALMIMIVGLLVAVFYCIDALYGERRDRSILFWKSMPVSDFTTVLSKASIPILVLPLVLFAVTVAVQLLMLLASSAVLAGNGMSAATPWTRVPFFEVMTINLVHLVALHGFWYAPFYGWLLMASAWSKRAPFLWATLPPVAIGAVERIAFNRSDFASMVQSRLMGRPEPAAPTREMSMDMLALHPPDGFLIGPGMWIGLTVTAAFLFAAVRLRRSRPPI